VPSLPYGLVETTSFQFSHFAVVGIQLSRNNPQKFQIIVAGAFSSDISPGKSCFFKLKPIGEKGKI
jgi:hypothetical protein